MSTNHYSGAVVPASLKPDPLSNYGSTVNARVNRILIIDDEDRLRRVIQLTLKLTAGWEVLMASSGWEGLQIAETEHPDAILLDLMMPDMDGFATLVKLRENPVTANIPVILLTAKVQASDRPQFTRLGVSMVLVKPFDPNTLARQIADALNWELSILP